MKRNVVNITKQMNCKKLKIQKIASLPCEICNKLVEHFNMCISGHVYCSEDCYEIVLLSL